ncbi:DsrE family protein [Hydrogenophilus thiooxidans]|uniref:DsrE family protein n=1 Tax=Hydrogenophilus thiooxidans TaxID=2820326 RepID=UPI001C21E819|nr:DsrE family protein [Hydrogenophilus thiooxidans]
MNKRTFVQALLATVALGALAPTARADEPVKAVYHFTQGVEEAARGLNNISNHLDADPSAKIVVVANGKAGVQFLLEDAVDPNGKPFAERIGALASRGVEFRVCNNTLTAFKIPKEKVAMEAKIVPSGVAEVARLQAKEGYAYIRP